MYEPEIDDTYDHVPNYREGKLISKLCCLLENLEILTKALQMSSFSIHEVRWLFDTVIRKFTST